MRNGSLSLTDRIRDYGYTSRIVTARSRGETHVVIRAGDIHDEMNLSHRVPAVVGAFQRIFEQSHNVICIDRSGPEQGPTTTWTFKV